MLYDQKVRKDFWETFCSRYDAGDRFAEYELKYMAYDCSKEVEEIEGDSHRWSKDMTTIFECDGRFFQIDWNSGLTEYQEDEFFSQPEEVVLHEYEKLVKVRDWIAKKDIEACAFKNPS